MYVMCTLVNTLIDSRPVKNKPETNNVNPCAAPKLISLIMDCALTGISCWMIVNDGISTVSLKVLLISFPKVINKKNEAYPATEEDVVPMLPIMDATSINNPMIKGERTML